MGHSRPLFFIFVFSIHLTVNNCSILILLRAGFELWTFNVGSNRSSNWATTAALESECWIPNFANFAFEFVNLNVLSKWTALPEFQWQARIYNKEISTGHKFEENYWVPYLSCPLYGKLKMIQSDIGEREREREREREKGRKGAERKRMLWYRKRLY